MSRARRLCRMALAGAWTLATAASAAAPPTRVFQDWALRCNAGADCVLEQRVLIQGNDDTPLLRVAFRYAGEPQGLTLAAVVPLGVLLGAGVRLRIDGGAPRTLEFHHCLPDGCTAVLAVSDKLAAALKRGHGAAVEYRIADGRGLAVPLSLRGLGPGLKALAGR